jgi:threonine 3-dehydrogenase
VGQVEEVGTEVTGVQVGDRVSGEGHITCGHCRNCRAGKRHLCRNTFGMGVNRDGCFAEYLSIPAGNVFKMHPDASAMMWPPSWIRWATRPTPPFPLIWWAKMS